MDGLYCAAGSPSTVPIASGFGLKPLIIPQRPYTDYVDEMGLWSEGMIAAGAEPARPKVAVWLYCAGNENHAREAAMTHMNEFSDSSLANYELSSDHFKNVKGYEYYAQNAAAFREAAADGRNLQAEAFLKEHCWGTPEMCYERIKEINEILHTEEIVLQAYYGTMGYERFEKSVRLFAEEVLPAARELPVLDPLVPATTA